MDVEIITCRLLYRTGRKYLRGLISKQITTELHAILQTVMTMDTFGKKDFLKLLYFAQRSCLFQHQDAEYYYNKTSLLFIVE